MASYLFRRVSSQIAPRLPLPLFRRVSSQIAPRLPLPLFRRVSSQIAPRLPLPSFVLPSSLEIPFSVGSTGAPSLPSFSMELMAVPKKKVSRFKKGLRNGPKALKPVPVIVRCNGVRDSADPSN